ncbi:TonB-dependent receptor [Roseateles koreensis]|uniref:TonB-dependent receptor n=1 Tax=Roseateles koreensis TaxID=2987526 RepID=A0ABT5KWU4_9BURK|nr:TonB-dependent receptor [Roseateles koreensis]MDC8786818.1 TonB-dependent receptor [Roseateles koreensis]
MQMKQKKLAWLIHALFLAPAALSVQAQAQAQQAPDKQALETVTVTGIRASVRSALEAKEASNGMVEVISSEDIGKLPDTTIAESLARLPGLSAGIDRGNASQIVARGLGPRFVGATLNGREFASSEPDRAVRFEMFPSESVSGATVYKTQSAELVEGGIATTIDLQTVQPLAYKTRQLSLKADALYYQLASDIDGAKKYAPRLGGVYIDQFADNKLGVALAFSYYDQPSLEDRTNNWGFNENNSGVLPGTTVSKTPWGFQNSVKKGTDKRSSVLGKLEYKPSADLALTGDVYYARSNILEPQIIHVQSNVGNWNGWQSGAYSNYTVDGGYVTGATVSGVNMDTINAQWKQDMTNFAGGVNGKFKTGDWQFEGDIAGSTATRDTMWSAVNMTMLQSGSVNWNFPKDGWMTYGFSQDTGNPANYANSVSETWGPTYAGKLHDSLNSQSLSASRFVDWGDMVKLKFGLRATQREKSYNQVSWDYGTATIPTSEFQRVSVAGRPDFIEFKGGFADTVGKYFGSSALSADGRTATTSDLVQQDWRAKESNTAVFVQGDLAGTAFGGLSYRGNVGARLVHTTQTGYGNEQVNGGAPTPVSDGTSYTRFLPSLNLILNLDDNDVNQVRFGVARAMSRAPLDVMNDAHVVNIDKNGVNPTTISGGNPQLKPMMANQVDLAFQHYFGKGNLVSVGVFYKDISDYIGIASVAGTYNGQKAYFTQQVNRDGGHVDGIELIYQQAFTTLPEPFNGLGLAANYTYTDSNIQENGDKSGSTFTPIATNGLMKHNGGLTLWYERNGFEARLAVNAHSAYNRAPTWDSTAFQINGAETWASLNLSQQLNSHVQLRFGVENLTNQKVTYTDPVNPYYQNDFQFGRRFNVGLSYKL